MAITNGYCNLPELKHRLNIPEDDAKDDTPLESVITAVSRWIDSTTGTRFYTATETRYYLAYQDWLIDIDPLITLTSVKTDPNGDATYLYTWASTDYQLVPYNAAAAGQPYTGIESTALGAYRFPVYPGTTTRRSRVQVTGSFGYSTLANVPAAIKEACLLVSMRVWGRKDLLYGVSGAAELGTLQAIANLKSDGEVWALLNTIKRKAIA